MGDTAEPSSNAAQRALPEETDKPRGFFGRIIGALSPSDVDGGQINEIIPEVAPASPLPGMLNLKRMRVEDVSVPKAEIIAVPDDIRKDELVKVFRESGLTRLPVYSGTLDTPTGLIHLKDMALTHGFNGNGGGRFSVRKLVRPLLYAPPSMTLGVLLLKMQSQRIHMALVIDEYGGVDGLVTIEDLIEQVVGAIEDEHDVDEGNLWTLEKPGCYLVESRTPLEEFEEEIGMVLSEGLDDEDIETLGGLVFVLCGRVPARGELVRHPNGPEFEVIDADLRRIKRMRVRLPAKTND